MKKFFLILIFLLPLKIFAASPATHEIITMLNQSVRTWNNGDIHAFVKIYKNSNSTLYISKSVIHGYQDILKRYVSTYSSTEKMGKLSYSQIEVKILSPKYAMAIGHWILLRNKNGNIGGIFSLLLEKTSQGWKIVVDHTS